MFKSIVLGLTGLAILFTVVSGALRYKAGALENLNDAASDTLTAIVLVDSIRVIAYVDSMGVARPPDRTLVPPVPIEGITSFQVVVPRRAVARPVAARERQR